MADEREMAPQGRCISLNDAGKYRRFAEKEKWRGRKAQKKGRNAIEERTIESRRDLVGNGGRFRGTVQEEKLGERVGSERVSECLQAKEEGVIESRRE